MGESFRLPFAQTGVSILPQIRTAKEKRSKVFRGESQHDLAVMSMIESALIGDDAQIDSPNESATRFA